MPAMIPELHASFLRTVLERVQEDRRLVGLAVGGSYLAGTMDEYSDLDLVIAVEPDHYKSVLAESQIIAERMGSMLSSFTGEHVGEPRVLICLFGPPLLHVDLKFISLADAGSRVEDPKILFERDGRFTAALGTGAAEFPQPDLQWIEDRFWVWVHYGAGKIGRGELFEAVGFLSFLRERVLGPLALQSRGARPSGVRKLERLAPERAREMEPTVAAYDARSGVTALRCAVGLYRSLRAELSGGNLRINTRAEKASIEYLDRIEQRLEK